MLDRRKYTDSEIKELLNHMVILVDTREKVNDHILNYFDAHHIKYESATLPSGDYSFALEAVPELDILHRQDYMYDLTIERKNSLEELSGCFAQTRERFNNEWSRCYAKRRYLIIENANYADVIEGKYNTQYNSKSFLGSLHSFNAKFGLEIMFMPDKQYTPVYILATCQYYLRYLIK